MKNFNINTIASLGLFLILNPAIMRAQNQNGLAVDSLAANGTISSTTVPFLIGNVHYTNADYLLTGKMDEVSFWNRAITQQEIHCIYLSAVDTASLGLQLYYKFDQAIAGG